MTATENDEQQLATTISSSNTTQPSSMTTTPNNVTTAPQATTSNSMEAPTVPAPKPHIPIIIKIEAEAEAEVEPTLATDNEDNRSTPERDTTNVRVRVKTEPREATVNENEAISKPTPESTTTTEAVATPPPTTTTEAVATPPPPTIVPTNINPEPITAAAIEEETFPDDLIDELLTAVDELANEHNDDLPATTNETVPSTTTTTTTTAAEAVTASSTIRVKTEMNLKSETVEPLDSIPDDFFDDLLADAPKEEEEEEEIELTVAERLRELKQLEEDEHKTKKKKKKNKKEKSKDKDKEREKEKESRRLKRKYETIETVTVEREQRAHSPNLPSTSRGSSNNNNYYNSQPFRVKAEFSRRSPLRSETMEVECLPVHGGTMNSGFKRIKLEKRFNTDATANVPLTPQEKRVNAIQRAIAAMNLCAKPGNTSISAELQQFHYTSTVRKLPASNSHLTPEIYENRSPLHTVHNVSYKFSSSNTRLNLREWGLESMPSAVLNLASLLAYDANSLQRKLRTIKIPGKLQQNSKSTKAESMQTSADTQSTYYTNATTQTEAVRVLPANDKRRKHDIGVQAQPIVGSIGSQTTTTTAVALQTNGHTPLQRMFDALNEHQQMAVLDFAELIRESADSALDMYQLRQRMLAIYNSAKVTKQTTMPTTTAMPVLAPHPADPRRGGVAFTNAAPAPVHFQPRPMMVPHPAHNMGVAHVYAQPQPPAPPRPHPNNMHYYPRY